MSGTISISEMASSVHYSSKNGVIKIAVLIVVNGQVEKAIGTVVDGKLEAEFQSKLRQNGWSEKTLNSIVKAVIILCS